ncbi:MAG: LysM peptidoglycan-binding domain-containing protein, partial [Candidatus Riflebacteria bacterium]|nr:LysM peptidoglycan-binding domain-containing protein [Candidatus Riflebacteria bacterium]
MKKKCVYLFLLLGLLLGQNNATFAKNDQMSVNKNNAAKVTISDAKDKAEAPKDKKEVKQTKEKEEVKKEEPQKPKKKVVIHKVKSGESLWAIAQEHLGDGNRWRELVDTNKGAYPSLLKNPNLIYTGWDLKVELDEEETQNKVAT